MTETTTYDKDINTRIKTTCSQCGKNINHLVLKSVCLECSDEHYGSSTSYQIIKCEGCDKISFRSVSSNSEDYLPCCDENGQDFMAYIEYEELYPYRNLRNDRSSYFTNLPPALYKIYQETMKALNSNLPVLTGIGIRAIIEAVVKAASAQGNNLEQKIDGLVALSILTPKGAKALHKLRMLGNNAAHEVKAHKQEELILAMDIIENMLDAVYVLPQKVSNVLGQS